MSTSTQSDNILRQMKDYDFKGKITATVILDESDEESGPTVESESNDSAINNTIKKLDSFIAEIIGEIEKINETKIRRSSSEIDHQKVKKRKEDDSAAKKPNESVNSNYSSNSTFNNLDFRTDLSLNTQNKSPMQRHDNIEQLLQNQDDINKKANECIESLLNTVSTHMVLIMKAFVDFKTFTTNSLTDITIVERAKKRYLDTKKHFFYLSYSTVVNIIIPKENDRAFVQSFFENTIRIANYRHLYPNFTDMHSLYCELVAWVKSNFQQLQSVRSLNPYVQHPMLTGLLSKSSDGNYNSNNTSQIYRHNQLCQNTNCTDSTCILKSGTPRKETTINRTSNSLNYQSAGQQILKTNQNMFVQNNQSQRENMSNLTNFGGIHQKDPVIPASEFNSPGNNQTYAVNQNISDHSHRIPDNTSNVLNYEQAFEVFSSTYYNDQLKSSKEQRSKNKPTKSKQRRAQTNNKQLPAQTNTKSPFPITLPLPLPYPSTQLQQRYMTPQFSENQYITSAHYNQDFQQDLNGQVEVNRSLSRDSGFMSPSSSIDHTCSSPRQDQAEPSLVTPMIVHVTSLNPSVAFIKDGTCYLCGKYTKQKCLGCYKTYYCSNQCQMADWKYHFAICKL